MKTCSGKERIFRFDCGVDDKNSTKQSLAKPSTIHILIQISMLTMSDSYLTHDSSALCSAYPCIQAKKSPFLQNQYTNASC
jgi:hypothetical protein